LKATAHHADSGEDQTAKTDDSTRINREGLKRSHKRLRAREIHRSLSMGNARK
jgi:hypothetical protein